MSSRPHSSTPAAPYRLVRAAYLLLCAGLSPLATSAQSAANSQETRLAEAIAPLESGVPAVTVARLRALLAGPLRPDLRDQARLRLVEALVAAGRAQEALNEMDAWRVSRATAFAFWRAQALAAGGRWQGALQSYRTARKTGPVELRAAAALGEAEALVAIGDTVAARRLIDELAAGPHARPETALRQADLALAEGDLETASAALDRFALMGDPTAAEPRYLRARLELAAGRPETALALFEALDNPGAGVSRRVSAGAALGRARALDALGRTEEAQEVLEAFIEEQPSNPDLGVAFAHLDDLMSRNPAPALTQVREWLRRSPEDRAAWADWLRGRCYAREGNLERAESSFARVGRRQPPRAASPAALADLAWVQIRRGNPAGAIVSAQAALKLLPDRDPARGRARFVLAEAQFILQLPAQSASSFERAGTEGGSKLEELAAFNAALAWLSQGSYERFLDDYKNFSTRYPESGLRRELLFQEGRRQARSGDPRAFQTLSVFVRDFPDHRRVPDALLAMAEAALLSDPPNPQAGSYYLKASTEARPPAPADQVDYLALFLADSEGRPPEEVIALGRDFLARHADSALVPDVRMKIGEVCFRIEDYAAAQTEFETAARERPSDPFAENALYLAGQAAVRSMNTASVERALDLFEQVARRGGPLKLAARREQARVKLSTGKEEESIALFDDILASNPEEELAYSARLGRGEALFSLGAHDPKRYAEALRVFDEVARDATAPDRWRNQAVWRKGRTLEKSGDSAAALAAYYEVLERAPSEETDYFWFYRAAFDAARLLEAAGDWKAAIAVYRRIAARPGPRAAEAAERVTRLRLEHFLWEE